MTTYEHICDACSYEWDEVYGMTVDPPTLCPDCGVEGKVSRLISGGSGPGIMRKSVGEIRANMASDIRALKIRANTDENFRANLVGEENYNQRVLKTEALEKELVSIGKRASAIKSTDTKPVAGKAKPVKTSATRPKIKSKK